MSEHPGTVETNRSMAIVYEAWSVATQAPGGISRWAAAGREPIKRRWRAVGQPRAEHGHGGHDEDEDDADDHQRGSGQLGEAGQPEHLLEPVPLRDPRNVAAR